MGNCSGSEKTEKKPLNQLLEEEYKDASLPILDQSLCNTELEKELYIVANMIRSNPKRMAKLIDQKLKAAPIMTKEGSASIGAVQKFIEKMETLPPLA